ncbi:unnamed protein product [Ostreobium quekettii]|uniref:Protein kinase domain-containing protein n=1 Tax=Ostreobium quekettii TaxID=121088 RepID=A0A8S1J929_9CHLO|nr:unnamed protein product [Ostreobium quekettii]|eukprot:evm.model.scf_1206.1 EVM.evm.TU.scf_1206.1   scf_1206:38005-45077(+)
MDRSGNYGARGGSRRNGEIGPGGRYQLGKNLNEGHFGKVKLAYDKVKDKYVAIKFIPRGPQVTEYVEREILNHRTLCQTHIIAFKEVFVTDLHLCIVMEYAAGGDMHQFIGKHKCLPEQCARWFFQQLMIAIQYCHLRDVVNRDIKLENILLDREERLLKVCDFGFSKGGDDSEPKTCVGTPSYLAPEVLRNGVHKKRYDGKRVDIWTCGVCLFVMLYGYYPFDDPYDDSPEKTKKMLARIAGGKVEIPHQQFRPNGVSREAVTITEECRNLLAGILEANPAKRMSMDQIMHHPWFQRDLPVGALKYNEGVDQIDESTIARLKGLQSVKEIKAIVQYARTPGNAS